MAAVPRIVAKTYQKAHIRGLLSKRTATPKKATREPSEKHLGHNIDIYV